MSSRYLTISTLVLVGVAITAWSQTEPHDHGARPEATGAGSRIELSEGLRGALLAEMAAIDQGIGVVASAIAAGDWKMVSAESEKIQGSYILRQDLSEAQLQELHHALPPDFLALDGRFHEHAGHLAHAAEKGDAELAIFYLTKLLDGCVACHTRFAPEAFPGFAPNPGGEEHHTEHHH